MKNQWLAAQIATSPSVEDVLIILWI